MSRWLNRLQCAAACLGLLLIAVSIGYPLHVWTSALSAPWVGGKGGVLIVLGADIVAPDMIGMGSFWRSVYAVREWRTGRYSRIVVSGKDIAPVMKEFIVGQGVPSQSVQIEGRASSTRENALFVAELLREDANPKVLLTSDFHMRRALGAFRKAGIEAGDLPIPDAHKRLSDWTQRWGIACMLFEETLKLGYYKARGWA